jgi:plastocyanin
MKPTLVRNPIWLALVIGMVLVGCEDDPTGPSNTGAVNITDTGFDPEDIVVAAGGTVTWTWTGSLTHNVTFASASITDATDRTTGTFSATMPTTPGVYTYQCTNHPIAMNGSVEVQ